MDEPLDDAGAGNLVPGPLALVSLDPGTPDEVVVPVEDRLFIGRECHGIAEAQRLVIEDPEVSRNHAEIRLEHERARAAIVDTSTNGTRVNGLQIERAASVALKSGDRIQIGSRELEFRASGFRDSGGVDLRRTLRRVTTAEFAMVVGDIVDFSTLSQGIDSAELAEALDQLFGELAGLLRTHRGRLSNYMGDALFAVWETAESEDAVDRAIAFAVDAEAIVAKVVPSLSISHADESPIRMGFGVAVGEAAVSLLTGTVVAVLGDAANLSFRLSAVAGRDGHPAVLVSEPARHQAGPDRQFGEPIKLEVKGRATKVTAFPAG